MCAIVGVVHAQGGAGQTGAGGGAGSMGQGSTAGQAGGGMSGQPSPGTGGATTGQPSSSSSGQGRAWPVKRGHQAILPASQVPGQADNRQEWGQTRQRYRVLLGPELRRGLADTSST